MGAAKRDLDTEVPFAKYLGERIKQLDLPVTEEDLHKDANALARRKGLLLNYRNGFVAAGGSLLAVGVGIASTSGHQSLTPLLPAILGSFALAFALLWTGFRALRWNRYLRWFRIVRVEFKHMAELASILEKVSDSSGGHRIMRIAASGAMQTPATLQPSDWILGPGALADRFIALSLFGELADQDALIVIVPAQTGKWQNYYFWHPPVRDRLAELWGKSVSKYQKHPVDHHKVRVALEVLADFASSGRAETVQAGQLESTLTKLLILALKREARKLLGSDQINVVEAAEMEEIALKVDRGGEAESRATTLGTLRRSSGSDRWFHRLRNADYPAICLPLKAAVKAELGIDPSYVERKTPTIVEHSKPEQTRMC